MDLLFIIAGLLLLIPVLSMVKAQRRKMVAFALPCAVEIAKSHGWVSAGRLMAQANMSEADAKAALAEACRQGLLVQAGDGRYYAK